MNCLLLLSIDGRRHILTISVGKRSIVSMTMIPNPVIRRCCGEYDVSKTLLKKHPNVDFRNAGSPYRNHREMPLSCEKSPMGGG